jgi:hypothetical protein
VLDAEGVTGAELGGGEAVVLGGEEGVLLGSLSSVVEAYVPAVEKEGVAAGRGSLPVRFGFGGRGGRGLEGARLIWRDLSH